MSDNPQTAPAQEFRLPGHDVLAITGRDAVAFAQAQFMNDVAALPAGHWHWNGWLSPKGRVIALFALLRFDAETLWLILPDAHAEDLAAALRRYLFRSKLTLAVRDDLHAHGRFARPTQASGATFAIDGDAVELDVGGDGGPRTLRIAPATAADDAMAAAHWRRFDLQHGLPRLHGEQVEAWTPQQLSLERLHAFSVKKGCYPGQEIVARTHFLGKAKRGLMRLQGAGIGALGDVMAATPGEAAPAGARAIGQMICAEGDEGLAVMPLDAGDGPFSSDDRICRQLPLRDGLAR